MLRDATANDLASIRRWRNHERVRDASIFTDEITADGHAAWWRSVQADPSREVLVFEYLGTASGVVLINDHDPVSRTAEWGFFLDVDGLDARGQLLPAWLQLEKEAIAYGFDVLGLEAMGGRTLAWNEPVLALHRRFGFVEIPERGYVATIKGTAQAVVWTERRSQRS